MHGHFFLVKHKPNDPKQLNKKKTEKKTEKNQKTKKQKKKKTKQKTKLMRIEEIDIKT